MRNNSRYPMERTMTAPPSAAALRAVARHHSQQSRSETNPDHHKEQHKQFLEKLRREHTKELKDIKTPEAWR